MTNVILSKAKDLVASTGFFGRTSLRMTHNDMTQLHSIYEELKTLKAQLKKTTNRLWSLKFLLTESYDRGEKETNFLPRRLLKIREEEQLKFESLTDQLNQIITNYFDKELILFNSLEDIEIALRIRRTIHYMKNAFTSEPFLIQTLDRLNKVLPLQINSF